MRLGGDSEKFRKSVSRIRNSVVASKSMANVFSDSVDKFQDDTSSIIIDFPKLNKNAQPAVVRSFLKTSQILFLRVISSTSYNFSMGFIILFGATGDDIRLISSSSSEIDSKFDIALFVAFLLLVLEQLMKLIWKPLYAFTLWMVFDCIGNLSILFRIITHTQDFGGRFNNITRGDFTSNVILSILLLVGQICLILRLVRKMIVSKFIRKSLLALSVYMKLTWSAWYASRRRRRKAAGQNASDFSDGMKRGYSKSRNTYHGQLRIGGTLSRSRMSLIGDGPSDQFKSSLRKSVTAMITDFESSDDDDEKKTAEESIRVGTRTRMDLDETLGLSSSNPFSIGRAIWTNFTPSDIENELGKESMLSRTIKERSILLTSFLIITMSVVGYTCFVPSIALSISNNVATMVANSLESGYKSGDPIVYQLSLGSAITTATIQKQGLMKIAWIGSIEGNVSFNSTDSIIPTLSCPDIGTENFVSIRYGPTVCPSDVLRRMDIGTVFSFSDSFVVITDASEATYWRAVFSLIFSSFVFCSALLACCLYLRICNTLLLYPLARVTRSVNRIRGDPGSATRLFEKFVRIEVQTEMKRAKWNKMSWQGKIFIHSPPNIAPNEPRDLERDVLKICSLLVVGFGKEGTEVVVSSIQNTNEEGLKVVGDAGNKVECVFGYISICDFETITEVLESKMILFVNQIAEIVHGIVDEFSGFTCRSTGDGFFVVWKIENGNQERICELAVLACLVIMIAIRRSPGLAEYKSHPHLKNRLKNFQVELGMSLHLGIGIEGAIGSEFKLEANYLGQHAVIVQRLERIAKRMYHVPFVVTGSLSDALSRDFKNAVCRRIDRIYIDDFTTELFVIDVDLTGVKVMEPVTQLTNTLEIGARRKLVDSQHKVSRLGRRKQKLDTNGDYDPLEVVIKSRDILLIRGKYMSGAGELFRQIFDKGLVNYEAGEWALAETALRQTLVFWKIHTSREERATSPRSCMNFSGLAHTDGTLSTVLDSVDVGDQGIDGPSYALLQRMNCLDDAQREHWNGVRKL